MLLFYQNNKSVIIGRNQNPWKECRVEKIKENKVDLCRRFSGGGAVYQDMGNLCFSFINPMDSNILPLDIKDLNNIILKKAFEKLNIDLNA